MSRFSGAQTEVFSHVGNGIGGDVISDKSSEMARMNSPGSGWKGRLFLLAIVVCLTGAIGTAQANRSSSTAEQTQTILAEAKRIDNESDAADSLDREHKSVEFPNWQLSGLFHGSIPRLLTATYTEGQVVRDESYYLKDGKLLLVKVARWWDVEEERNAPEPTVKQNFYINNDQVFRRVIRTGSGPKSLLTIEAPEPAKAFDDRWNAIAKILLSGSSDAKLTEPLREFPAANLPKKN